MLLEAARQVVIVPGYGMAVSQANMLSAICPTCWKPVTWR